MPNQWTPVTVEDRAEIIRLHGEGKGRNEIARLTGRAQRTVSVICAEEGLVFDASMTEEATRHRVAQLAALRADTAVDLHLDALRLTQQMWEPATIYNFGGKDNTYNDHHVDEPPAGDKKNLMAAAGIALEKSLKLVPPADDAGAEDARSMLGQLMVGLKAAYDQAVAEEGSTGEEAEGESP
ncbi:helix-turn-helix domain-containing protein [Streptomyces cylindrosporus]|uniref:Helix-turn-helix domain-containing protein n=1 Tax=Streptomyces cylindrosporus TaxID=2927583 RepID=A0ABS9Y2H0_9ACTN|nr:helix-turn-helix domain-containing protein [Streptomyces cylindrosporus]MCI3271404.1 helix-turn-helix domain-containing protein [Streptomyces cylindrosporus]